MLTGSSSQVPTGADIVASYTGGAHEVARMRRVFSRLGSDDVNHLVQQAIDPELLEALLEPAEAKRFVPTLRLRYDAIRRHRPAPFVDIDAAWAEQRKLWREDATPHLQPAPDEILGVAARGHVPPAASPPRAGRRARPKAESGGGGSLAGMLGERSPVSRPAAPRPTAPGPLPPARRPPPAQPEHPSGAFRPAKPAPAAHTASAGLHGVVFLRLASEGRDAPAQILKSFCERPASLADWGACRIDSSALNDPAIRRDRNR